MLGNPCTKDTYAGEDKTKLQECQRYKCIRLVEDAYNEQAYKGRFPFFKASFPKSLNFI